MKNRLHHRLHNRLLHLAALLTVLVLATSAVIPATAAGVAEGPTGTLTMQPKHGDKILTAAQYNGTFKVYHIADYVTTGEFTKDEDLKDLDVEITGEALSGNESFKILTEDIAAYVKTHTADIDPIRTGIKVDETLTLPYGLYLIMSDRKATGYQTFEPFLAMIPEYGENMTNTNVIAYPKVSPEPDEPDEPHESHEPSPPPPAEVEQIEEAGEEITPPPTNIEEAGILTGDESQMRLYGIVAIAAVTGLIAWTAAKHRKEN